MKTALITLILLLPHIAFSQATQVQIETSYRNVDPTFTKDILDKSASAFSMPTVTTKSGSKAVINIIREYRFLNTAKEANNRNSGVIIEITPTINGNKINIIGKSTISRRDSWRSKSAFNPITFTTRETFFEGTTTSGNQAVIKLSEFSEEKLILKLTLIDSDGKPIK